MRKLIKTTTIVLLIAQLTGCSLLVPSGVSPESVMQNLGRTTGAETTNKKASPSDSKITNPPARTMRFDGHEIVLGESEGFLLDTEELGQRVSSLITQKRMRSAALLVLQYRETAERMLFQRWASDSDDAVVQLAAVTLSQRSNPTGHNWQSLLDCAKAQRGQVLQYQDMRNDFADQLQDGLPSFEAAESLVQAAVKISHPLPRVDALRLCGLRELVAGRHAWAESQLRQAIDLASSAGNTLLAAELWLTVAEITRQNNQPAATTIQAWNSAIALHLSAYNRNHPLDVGFWLQADKIRPVSANWPAEVSSALAAHLTAAGCDPEDDAEVVLWTAVAAAQFTRGELQSALVNYKKAETMVQGNNSLWLRIAQAKCLAGLGQAPAAAGILSGPATSTYSPISAAATAAMGSIKLQSGAYQQGAQLLYKAIYQTTDKDWPGKDQSLADLAIAQLILGETKNGLASLREAQRRIEQSGNHSQLIRSLENELRLLEHEQEHDQSSVVQAKLAQLEKL